MKASQNVFPQVFYNGINSSDASTPSTGNYTTGVGPDGIFYVKNSSGTSNPVGAGVVSLNGSNGIMTIVGGSGTTVNTVGGVITINASGGGGSDPTTTAGDMIYRNSSVLTRLPIAPSAGYVLMANSTGGGPLLPSWGTISLSGAWTLLFTDAGTSLTNWTTKSGTWVITSGAIQQTSTASGGFKMLAYTGAAGTLQPNGAFAAQWDFLTGQSAVAFTTGGTSSDGFIFYLADGTQVGMDDDNHSSNFFAVTTDTSVWVTVRVLVTDCRASFWINGTFIVTVYLAANNQTQFNTFCLATYNTVTSFRNIKLWVPTTPF